MHLKFRGLGTHGVFDVVIHGPYLGMRLAWPCLIFFLINLVKTESKSKKLPKFQ